MASFGLGSLDDYLENHKNKFSLMQVNELVPGYNYLLVIEDGISYIFHHLDHDVLAT